ncbi:MAG: FAD-dependent oxidoreductase [bacterium]
MVEKLVIVGGVAGGAGAATRARRLDENVEIVLFERGQYVSFANCGLPFYLGGEIKEHDDLIVANPEFLIFRYDIDVRISCEVTKIDREKKEVEVKDLRNNKVYTESYDKLILSPGAGPIRPPLEGIDLDTIFTIRSIPDIERIKNLVDGKKPESAVVVGGGFIGLEMAENLSARGVKVTIVEMLDQVMPPIDFDMAAIVHHHLRDKGVDLKLKDGVKSFRKDGEKTVVTTSGGSDIPCDLVVLSIGVKPENKLAKDAGLEIGERGGIKVDETLRTSDPDIFAVGDAIEVMDFVTRTPAQIPLAGPANRQGRIAAGNALGRNFTYKDTQGTAVVKVFDITVASTGSSEKLLKKLNIPHKVSYTHSASHAGYYPGAGMMAIKLMFAPDDGKVFGAQIVGRSGVDKRIDVIATAIRGGMTVYDLEDLELAYAPPYSSAKDPVNMAGFVAANLLRGDCENIYWNELKELDREEYVLLDLREKNEIEETDHLEGSIHIPLNELRNKLLELDNSKTYIPYCAIGLRGYVACRILIQNGFKAKNLSGGYRTYCFAENEASGGSGMKCPKI